jgi:hypothetical protein
MLDFVQPAGSGGRVIGGRRFARADETDRRESSAAGRGGAPDVPQATEQGSMAVTAMRIMLEACPAAPVGSARRWSYLNRSPTWA